MFAAYADGYLSEQAQSKGYVADLNHHMHLAAPAPDAAIWLFLYEIPFTKPARALIAE